MKKKIILIDGHNLLFKMFYGIPSSIKNSKGKEIKGLIGFLGSLKKIVDKFNPYSLVVIFDSETSKVNNSSIDNNYKANRKNYNNVCEEENPFYQLPIIKKALDFLNICYLEVANNEADDYIASLIANNNSWNNDFIIVSNDTDFIQLIDDNVFLYVLRGKNSVLYDKQLIMAKYQVLPSKYVIYKSLVGDKSDNIDGIHGIGKVTATSILKNDSLETYTLKNENRRIVDLLKNNKSKIERNIKLINLNKSIDTTEVKLYELSRNIHSYKVYEIIEIIGER